jgi:hypothetical protein
MFCGAFKTRQIEYCIRVVLWQCNIWQVALFSALGGNRAADVWLAHECSWGGVPYTTPVLCLGLENVSLRILLLVNDSYSVVDLKVLFTPMR